MSFEVSVLETALASSNSCVRCRARRIGCDQNLPSCQPCLSAGAECELYDHILESKYPRSYLHALYLRLQALQKLANSPPTDNSENETAPYMLRNHVRAAAGPVSPPPSLAPSQFLTPPLEQDTPPRQQRPLCSSEPFADRRLAGWGPPSALTFFHQACEAFGVSFRPGQVPVFESNGRAEITSDWLGSCFSHAMLPQLQLQQQQHDADVPQQAATKLFDIYYVSIETFLPIVGSSTGNNDLACLYTACRQQTNEVMLSILRAQLILAISFRLLASGTQANVGIDELDNLPASRQQQAAEMYFIASLSQLRQLFSQSSRNDRISVMATAGDHEGGNGAAKAENVGQLQALLLVAIFVLLSPKHGNIWQILGYAERLWHGVGWTVPEDTSPPDGGGGGAGGIVSTLSLCETFVTLELMVGTAFGRPVNVLHWADILPPSSTIPSLVRQIFSIRARWQERFMAQSGLHDEDWTQQGTTWREQFSIAVEAKVQSAGDTDSAALKSWLREYGAILADETDLLILCLRWQAALGESPTRFTRPTVDQDHTTARELISSLLQHYKALLINPSPEKNPFKTGLAFTWCQSLEVFRTAVTVVYLSRVLANSVFTREIAMAVHILDSGKWYNSSPFVEALLQLVPD